MKKVRKLVSIALIAGTGFLAVQPADAWWGGNRWNDDDWWDRPGYYRYGGPYGWGGGPWGWGGNPYYGGWGGGPWGWGGYPGYYGHGYAPAGTGSKSEPAPPPRPE